MKELLNATSSLKNINWDFHDKGILSIDDKKPFDSRKFHWYPATYIPEIPYSLIEILSNEGATVYDPFAGSGTTFFQALLLNRNPITSDSNIISINYIKSLTSILLSPDKITELNQKLKDSIDTYDYKVNYINLLSEIKQDLLRPWFHKTSLNELAFLYKLYDTEKHTLKSYFYVLIAGILKSASSQDRGWGYIADNVKPKEEKTDKYKNILDIFQKRANLLQKELIILKTNIEDRNDTDIHNILNNIYQHDVTNQNMLQKNSVDIIITSPPYPNMIDYTKSQRLLYYFFDLDLQIDLNKEIGARAFRNRKNSVSDYIYKMEFAFKNINEVLKVDGLICLVLPFYKNTEVKNNQIRQEAINKLLDWFDKNNFNLEQEIIRTISATKRNQNTSQASLNHEQIIVLRKGK